MRWSARLSIATALLVLLSGAIPAHPLYPPTVVAAPVAPERAAADADQATPKPRTVRHRPGQTPKYQNLTTYAANLRAGMTPDQARAGKAIPHAALLASGTITDPMAGNYLTLPSEQLIVLADGGSASVSRSFVDSDSSFHLVGPQYSDQLSPVITTTAVAADLDGNGFAEMVMAINDGGCVRARSFGVTPVGQPRAILGPLADSGCLASFFSGSPVYNGGSIAIAVGSLFDGLGGPNAQQVLVAWEGQTAQSGAACVTLLDGPHLTNVAQQCAAIPTFGKLLVGLSVTAGDFNGDGGDEAAFAWIDPQGALFVHVWQYAPGAASRVTTPYKIEGYRSFAVALDAGDLDGDGADELVAATIDGFGTSIFSLWLTEDLTGLTALHNNANPGMLGGQNANWIAVAVGEFAPPPNGNLRANTGAIVYAVLNPPQQNGTCDPWTQTCPSCGAYGYGLCTTQAQVGVIFNPQLGGSHLSTTFDNYVVGQRLSVGAGTLNLDRRDPQRLQSQIVLVGQISDPGTTGSSLVMTALELTTPGGFVQGAYFSKQTSLTVSTLGTAPSVNQVVVGDYLGRSLRLGPPVYHNQPNVLQVQALLYEPPQHIDVFGTPTAPITINVNYNNDPNDLTSNGAWAQYQNRQQTTSQNTVQWGNSFQLSVEFSGQVSDAGAYLGGSVKAYGGADFEGSREQFSQQTFGESVSMVNDTVLVFTEADLDVWEYPVFSDGLPTPIGYVSIILPRKNPLENGQPCLVNCTVSGGVPVVGDARDITWWNPDHEPGNLLSWLAGVQATDVMTGIFDSGFKTTDQGNSWFMTWETISSTVSSTTWNVGVDLSVSGGFQGKLFGTGFEYNETFSGTYQHQGNTTYRTSFDQTTGLAFNYPVPNYLNAGYQVRSLVYWAKSFPFLWLNWMVDVQPTAFNLWGQSYATNPDPTFILRWRSRYGSVTDPAITRLTPDIRFSPDAVQVGQPVTITAIVRNYSLAGYQGQPPIPIDFYDGDPASGGLHIGHTTISSLGSLEVKPVSIVWTPHEPGVHTIFVKIGAVPGTKWIHSDNKLGFAQLAVAGGQSARQVDDPGLKAGGNFGRGRTIAFPDVPGHSADVRLIPGSLGLTRRDGSRVQLQVKLTADAGHFANVHVDFYEGTPARPSRHIAGQVVPLVWSGRTATAVVDWSPGRGTGARPIFARIRHFPLAESDHRNNQLTAVLVLGPVATFVPHAPLRSSAIHEAIVPRVTASSTRRRSRA
ncbi:MAG: hypothetical protein KatS3mg060_2427 [Dehalococcoidia bacterium]|nr:MAG: hypothetical protein KatS3mg060_2427 [Dehalococcoidia bacterium]